MLDSSDEIKGNGLKKKRTFGRNGKEDLAGEEFSEDFEDIKDSLAVETTDMGGDERTTI